MSDLPVAFAGRPVVTPPDVALSFGIPSAKRPPIPGSLDGAEEPNDCGPPELPLLVGGLYDALLGFFSLPTIGALRSLVTAFFKAFPC